MKAHPIQREEPRYVLTEKGKYDLLFHQDCDCNPRLAGILIQCPDCGTVFGSISEALSPPKFQRFPRGNPS